MPRSDEPPPRHRAQMPYPRAEDLLASMPPMRRDDILALLRSDPAADDFAWFGLAPGPGPDPDPDPDPDNSSGEETA